MKTSKKLLSLFLAMVMIITSCSVGLTAFAADANPTDSNNQYWSDGTDAEAAFDSLNDLANAYVPKLLGIDAVKKLLEENLGMKITDKTTISDVVAGASPLLLGALSGKGDKDSILGDNNADKFPDIDFAYLEDKDAAMDFWTLYKFCRDKQNAGGDLGAYCKETLPKLDKLLNVYLDTRNNVDNTFNEYLDYLSVTYFPYVASLPEYTAEAIDNVEVNGVKLKDIKDPKVDWLVENYDTLLKDVNADMSIKTIGDFIMAVLDPTQMRVALAKGLIKTYFPDEVDKYTDDELFDAIDGGNIKSPAYGTLLMATIIYSGLYTKEDIEAFYITDAQLEQYVADLKGNNMTGEQLREYYANNSPFSSYINYYIDYYLDNSIPFSSAAITGDIEKVKEVPSKTYPDKTYIEELNYIVSTRFFIDEISKHYGDRQVSIYYAYQELSTLFNYVNPETDKYSYKYTDYQIPSNIIVEATNSVLNDTIGGLLDPDTETGAMVTPIINSLLDSKIVLYDKNGGVLKDLWKNLYEAPIETVVNLIPTIVIALDELVVPLIFNEGDENQTDLMEVIGGKGGLLYDLSQAVNSEIGIGTLSFDLNKAIPAILHWLKGDTDYAYDLVGHYTGDFYDNSVPKFLNIYIADKLISGARIGTGNVTNSGLARTVYRSLVMSKDENGEYHNKPDVKDEELANAKDIAIGVDELVTEIATFAMEAIDEYVDAHGNDPRYKKDNSPVISQRGLNNLFVSLPQVIDNIGKKFIKKYAIKSDWTYTYDGKIVSATKEYDNGDVVEQLQNKTLEDFKATATLNNPDKVLDQFVNILIGNWINALLDFVNDLIQDDSNKITSELGLVQSLLAALGGFGETSIITDLFNGLFQLKRSDVPSFTLEKRDTGFVGFSNESGFFLLSNLQFNAKGTDEERGIIPLIVTLINGKDTQEKKPEDTTNTNNNQTTTESKAPLLVNSTTDYNKLLSKENVEASQALVDTLDELLSSLLANTSLNGFDWDSTDNLLSSLVTFASAYFGGQNTNDIVKILNDYLYFITGESKADPSSTGKIGTAPTADGNVDAKKVYTSANLSNLVIQTYSLIENIIDYLFYNTTNGLITYKDPNKLITDALYGIVSPDAVAVRMTSYGETAKILKDKDYLNWNSFKVQISLADTQTGTWKKDYLKYGFKDGDKTAFYDALGESLSGVAAIVGALLGSSTGYYRTILNPVLSSVAKATGAAGVMTADQYEAATDSQKLIKGIITPLGNILGKIYDAPLSFILNLVKGVAGVLDDTSVRNIINNALNPINGLLDGVVNIIKYLSPTFANIVKQKLGNGLSIKLPEKEIIVTLLNKLIGDINVSGVKLGTLLTLPIINWNKLATASSTGEVLLLIYGYLVDAVLDSTLLTSLLEGLAPGIVDILNNLTAAQIFNLLRDVLAVVQSPTEVYWTFSQYASKLTGKFAYPTGITAQDAEKAVDQLDDLVANVFPLLNGLGVTDIEGLGALVNDKLYTNEILTKLATALYGALNSNSTVVTVFGALNIDVTTKGVASYLTDKSYGKTYSSAAATLRKTNDWKKIKSLNWGFKDGSAKAKTGFVNGLAAVLRPLNDVLAIFLAEGETEKIIDLKNIISTLDLSGSTQLGETDPAKSKYQYGCKLSYILKDGILTLKFRSNVKTVNNKNNVTNVLKINLMEVIGTLQGDSDEDSLLDIGTNGYESAIIPLLEAFMCKDVKSYKQYKADYNKAKDNLLINVLKPIIGLVDDVLASPFDTVSKILPNVAYYIDSNGLAQLVSNLLAPITAEDGILGALDKNGFNVDKLIKEIAGKSLGQIVKDALGVKTKINLELHHLEKCNIQDIIVPLVQSLLKNLKISGKTYKINLPTFTFEAIASHGTVKTVKSVAKNREGKYTRKMVKADQGEVLVAVLRYVAEALIKNTTTINKALCGIEKIKKNETIKNILSSVFNTIKSADKDDIVRAVFYLLMDEATDTYFDYRNFKYKSYDFSFGDMDEDFCRTLAPMLDGLVSGLLEDKGGLLGLIGDLAYKDSTISTIACGLYGAVEGVKISDDIGSLTNLLAMTDIDFTTGNVASLLTDKAYGRTYESAASTIKSAGSWAKVNKDSLKWGVKDRDTFLNALCAVLRPIYGVLDVLLNDASLRLFDLVSVPGSDGYTSTIVPLLEAFGCYNIKTQYQYREDCFASYDSILLDIINPIWDKVEDILNAPIEMLADILPNLSLFFANDGLLQIIDNLLTPISALLNALKPIANVNDILDAAGLDINALLAKAGLNLNVKLDIYDLKSTLEPLIGADNVVNLLNAILGIIKIDGKGLGIVLPEIDWYKLASHGEVILNSTSQAATYGARISVKSDQDETLIAVLRFLIDTVNYKDNYDAIVGLVSGLLGDGVSDSVADMIGEVLGMLKGESDQVIAELVDLLQSIAG